MLEVNYKTYFSNRKYRVHVSEHLDVFFPGLDEIEQSRALGAGCVDYLVSCGHDLGCADYLTGALSWFDEYLSSFQFVEKYIAVQCEELPDA